MNVITSQITVAGLFVEQFDQANIKETTRLNIAVPFLDAQTCHWLIPLKTGQ